MISMKDIENDLEVALDAIEEIMVLDKGPNEEEWITWCNTYLPLMHKYDKMKYTVSFH